MIRFPYDIVLPRIPIPPAMDDDAERRYVEARKEHDHQTCDAQLAAMVADLATLPDAIALCAVSGGAHGYPFFHMIIQQTTGLFLVPHRSAVDEPVTFTNIPLALDLPTQLQALHHEGTLFRGHINHNVDHVRGYEGRISTLFIVVGHEAVWLYAPRPLLGGVHTNTAYNRLYRALLNMNEEITLI